MEVIVITVSGLVATTLMTGFSYLIAAVKKSQFREPELLNILITRSPILPVRVPDRHLLGWAIHYTIGWIFVLVFDYIWRSSLLNPTLASGCLLGFIAGIIGILGWQLFFTLSPDPPRIPLKNFYLQLLVAHVIFGLGAALVYVFW